MGPNNRRAFLPKLTGWEHQLVKVIIVPKLQNSKLQIFNKCCHWNSDDSLTVFLFPPVCLHDWKHCHSFHCSALNFPFPCWKWNAMETGYAMLRRGKCFSFFWQIPNQHSWAQDVILGAILCKARSCTSTILEGPFQLGIWSLWFYEIELPVKDDQPPTLQIDNNLLCLALFCNLT